MYFLLENYHKTEITLWKKMCWQRWWLNDEKNVFKNEEPKSRMNKGLGNSVV